MIAPTDCYFDDFRVTDNVQLDNGNLRSYPHFADPGNNDYHLLSERGRYLPDADPNAPGLWVLDEVSSPCVDAGDWLRDPGEERLPNGRRVNIGAYGGTAYGSMSEWPLAGDLNRDGTVNLIDFAWVSEEWLAALPWVE